MPGFSTADTIRLTSGRGVGMDVVRQEVEALKGTLEWTLSRRDRSCYPSGGGDACNLRIRRRL